MSDYTTETLELVRSAVARVREADLNGFEPTQSLQLDSVARIGLIAELENAFEIELPADAILPEAFESLASLAALIQTRR